MRGRYWRIYCKDEFIQSIENVTSAGIKLDGMARGVYYLKNDLTEPLRSITNLIHKNHPGKELEKFIAEIFRKISNVNEVIENGFGWGTDYGADLIVKYQSGYLSTD